MRLRLAFNTNGLAHHRLADAIDLVADLGYDGIALTPDHGHLDPLTATPREVEAVAAHLVRRGLGVCIQTGARYTLERARKHQPNLLDPEPSERERRVDLLRRCLDIGRDLGAGVLAFWSGTPLPGVSADDAFARLCDGAARVAEMAAERGMVAAFEPEPGMLIETMAGWERVRDAVGHPALKLALDVGHVHCNREGEPADFVRRHAAELADVQVEDMREGEHLHLPFGDGTLDIAPTVAALTEIGFAELVSVELSRDSHRAPVVAAAAIDHLRSLEK